MNKVEICNMALSRIGVSRLIDSLDELTTEAEQCSLFFNTAVEKVYQEGKFANLQNYAPLQLIQESPNDEWLYAYRYPNECLKFERVVMPYTRNNDPRWPRDWYNEAPHQKVEYTRGLLNGTNVIFTNLEDATGVYLPKPDASQSFESDIASIIAWRLAMEIAMPLAVEAARADRAAQYYRLEMQSVTADALNEHEKHEPTPEFIRARDGY